MNMTPFLRYGDITLLNVPCAEDLAKECIERDCYQLKGLEGTWAVADIGACYGEFTYFAKSLGHKVHAYEASAKSYTVAWMNGLFDLHPDELHKGPVCGRPIVGKVAHFYRPNHPAGSGPNVGDGIPEEVLPYRMIEVVNGLMQYELPIFIKMDVEGAEVDIFEHISTWMNERIKAVSMETHNHDADKFGAILESYGFNVKLSGTCPEPLPPWDKSMTGGLVIARRP